MMFCKVSNVMQIIVALICVSFSVCGYSQQLDFASIDKLSEQQVAGIVLPQIYQRIGQTISITPLPANRAQQAANSGEKDGEILRIYSYGDETPNVIRVPTPYYFLTTAVFARHDKNFVIKSLTDIAKYRVGIVRGVKHTNNATKGLAHVYPSQSSEQLFKQLAQGYIDIALTNYQDGLYQIEKMPENTFKVLNQALAYEPLYHYLNKKHASLVTVIDKMIMQLKASGDLEKMLKQAEQQVY